MMWVDVNNVCIRYHDTGCESRAIVFIHEMGGCVESFDGLADYLSRHFRMLRYDQRGSGLSEKPPTKYYIDDHVDDLEALLDTRRMTKPYIVVAAAAGSLIALAHAKRASTKIAGLVLCAPALGAESTRRAELLARADAARSGGMKAIVDATLLSSYPSALRADGKAYAEYRARFLANDPHSYCRWIELLVAASDEEQSRTIGTPCLVLGGQLDPHRPPAYLCELSGRLNRSRLVTLKSGHLMATQTPELVGYQILQFSEGLATTCD